MARFQQLPYCCGIHELGYIARDASVEDTIMSVNQRHRGAHVVFSVTSRETKGHAAGKRLVAFIEKHKLGPVVEAPPRTNTGHSGSLKAWMWSPSKAKLQGLQLGLYKKNKARYGYMGTFNRSVFWYDVTKGAH